MALTEKYAGIIAKHDGDWLQVCAYVAELDSATIRNLLATLDCPLRFLAAAVQAPPFADLVRKLARLAVHEAMVRNAARRDEAEG